jgi:hypothetical protein
LGTPRWHTGRSDAPLDRRLVAPFIANRAVALGSETAADLEAATFETPLDSSHADDLSALGTLLLCTESVASSKIEQIQANADDYARANSLCHRHGRGDHRPAGDDRDGRPERTHPSFRNNLGARSTHAR